MCAVLSKQKGARIFCHARLTGRNIGLYSFVSWLIRGAFRRRSAGGARMAAPAGVVRSHAPGRLRVTVRGHNGPLPSMAGLGQASGGEIPLRSGRRRAGRRVPGSYGPADGNRRVRSAGRRRAIPTGIASLNSGRVFRRSAAPEIGACCLGRTGLTACAKTVADDNRAWAYASARKCDELNIRSCAREICILRCIHGCGGHCLRLSAHGTQLRSNRSHMGRSIQRTDPDIDL